MEHKAPLGCNVTAASYLIRHAAIYANDRDYEAYMEPILAKLDSTSGWSGPLAFFSSWTSPIDDPENQMEKITPSGADDATAVGRHLLSLYPNLVPTCRTVYADKKSRTQDTAHAFVKGFPQHPDGVQVVEISETDEFQSTIPHKYCPAFTKAAGDAELQRYIAHYTQPIIRRLSPHVPRGVNLTQEDIVGMQQLCGYESAITGRISKICGIFTDTEWMSYEYAWDLKYYYMVGPGNPLSPYLGFPWLNVTASLFQKLHEMDYGVAKHDRNMDQRFFVSFTHREVPPFLATALGLFNSSSSSAETFPTDRINFGRAWRMAELIPFLGHIGMEKMTCDASSGADVDENGEAEFVRVIANSAPRPIQNCQGGPGSSCEIHQFVGFVNEGLEKYGDFTGICGEK